MSRNVDRVAIRKLRVLILRIMSSPKKRPLLRGAVSASVVAHKTLRRSRDGPKGNREMIRKREKQIAEDEHRVVSGAVEVSVVIMYQKSSSVKLPLARRARPSYRPGP